MLYFNSYKFSLIHSLLQENCSIRIRKDLRAHSLHDKWKKAGSTIVRGRRKFRSIHSFNKSWDAYHNSMKTDRVWTLHSLLLTLLINTLEGEALNTRSTHLKNGI